jgi:hypothetical protein
MVDVWKSLYCIFLFKFLFRNEGQKTVDIERDLRKIFLVKSDRNAVADLNSQVPWK